MSKVVIVYVNGRKVVRVIPGSKIDLVAVYGLLPMQVKLPHQVEK
jgi:hypothetical protein